MKTAPMDALAFLHSQTEDVGRRFTRGETFWKQAFRRLSIMPQVVQAPDGMDMLGCVAEEDLEAKQLLVVGEGFWWPKCAPPPDQRSVGSDQFSRATLHRVWGVETTSLNKDLLFFLNASSPMSLVNDYNGLAQEPNASLVSPPYSTAFRIQILFALERNDSCSQRVPLM